ncbi:MAG TPA: flavin reductase [Pseudonocardia sp.]|jgi:flavin reductase (DIM6/NTAB) family NADH-FMN oxidoreductase RutF|uniref:flavin reductase n=1 Tax=Pseudonocardia sp. TaxID=60912 RepID=UPI002F4150AD
MTPSSTRSIDGQRFREVLGNYPTGVTVVTAIAGDGRPAGMAVGSFTSVSLDPPLIAFLPDRSSTSFPKIRAAKSFCVNVLAADQEDICRAFAARGGDKFAGVNWTRTESGAPRINGVAAWIDCEFESVSEAGDHYLVLGRVRELHSGGDRLPLVFFQGGYGRFAPSSLVAVPEADFVGHLRLADRSRVQMERIAGQIDTECLAIVPVNDQLVVLGSAGAPSFGAEFTRVGQRMPFVPPIGTPFLAWAEETEVDAWLARSGHSMAAGERAEYAELLTRVRTRGWSLSLGNDTHAELLDAIDSYSEGDPDGRARVQRLGAQVADRFEPAEELEAEREYDVRLINVPVFGPDGSVALMLTLWGLPYPSTGAQVWRYLDVVLDAAAEITTALGGRPPA